MCVFACHVVSKLQRNRCPTFRDLRFPTNARQTELHFYIYIDNHYGRLGLRAWSGVEYY
jgi:hypothetical protein